MAMGKRQPPPIEQVVELLDEIDEAIRELHPDDEVPPSSEGSGAVVSAVAQDTEPHGSGQQ